VTVHPAARLGRLWLSARSLQWVGVRSYSIYLWHWPIYVITRPDVDVPFSGIPLLAFRLLLTVVAASLSYKYVEQPIRHGAFGRAWERVRFSRGLMRRRLALRWVGGAFAVTLVVGALGLAVAYADEPPPPEFVATSDGGTLPSVVTFNPTSPTTGATPGTGSNPGTTGTPNAAGSTTPAAPNRQPPAVSAIGDSVMLGAAETLWYSFDTNVHVNAAVGRQVSDALDLLRQYRDEGLLSPTMVMHIGNNGMFTDGQFDEMMQILGPNRRVFVLNTRVPRRWETPNNEVIFRGAKKYPNAYFVDWKLNAEQIAHTGFYDDGMHLRPVGAQFYADLILRSIGR
jgi:hypothetical protein